MLRALVLTLLIPAVVCLQACGQRANNSAEDRAEIANQLNRYAQLWDQKDSEGVVALLTEGATFEWVLSEADEQPPLVAGRESILQYTSNAHQVRLAGRQSRHHFSSLVFEELSATEAVTVNTLLVTHHLPGETPVVVASGVYRIHWVKTDGGWLMDYRKLFVDR